MDIEPGDTYDFFTSMSSLEQSLSEAAKQKNNPIQEFKCGDMNTTLIKTKLGKTIMLQFDVHTGTPYNRLNTVTGAEAVLIEYPSKLYVDHDELQWGHKWRETAEYKEYKDKYDHPLWQKLRTQISENTVGHGRMDFVMIYRLSRCLNEGKPLDIYVYDSILWSAVTPLSELPVAQGSTPIKVPDFTGGTWKEKNSTEMLREI